MTQSNNQQPTATFSGLGIAPGLLDLLEKLGYKSPTPIQLQSIPVALDGKDVVGVAQTGTGKTLAFGIPMLQIISNTKGRGLILLPTRELAIQVEESLRRVGQPLGLRTVVLIGGAAMGAQKAALSRQPHIIIATPGRLIDHLEQRTATLDKINILVLDEADRMLDMGFLPQIKRVLAAVPKNRQTMLFSATLPREIMAIATAHMKLPIRIEVAPSGTAATHVTQEIFIVKKDDKIRLLEKVLKDYNGSALVFTKMKYSAKRVAKAVHTMGHTAAELHSNRTLFQRREAMEGFRSGKYRVLVATDIAARGIDVKNIELVVNYDMPMQTADYVHRIGRTGRAGTAGHAISFALSSEQRDIRSIERLTRQSLRVSKLPELPPARAANADMPGLDRADHRHTPRGPFQKRGQGGFGGSRGPSSHHAGPSKPRRPFYR
jgi:ATP-dependent RNA helicase RhlE